MNLNIYVFFSHRIISGAVVLTGFLLLSNMLPILSLFVCFIFLLFRSFLILSPLAGK
jgi:hypothetical protein